MSNAETILVVEDEPLVGEEIREDLERLGYRVPEVVSSGDDVVPALARTKADLILMDIALDGSTDGIEAAFQAKVEFDVPVIYLTAYSDRATLERAAATDPAGYLLKPFDERELAANVRMVLAREKLRKNAGEDLGRYGPVLAALPEPVLVVGMDERVVHGNQGAADLLAAHGVERLRGEKIERFLIGLGDQGLGAAGKDARFAIRAMDGSFPSATARVEALGGRTGGRSGTIVLFEQMGQNERSILEHSARQANQALQSVLPKDGVAMPDLATAGFHLACPAGSGDLYDVFPLGTGRWGFYSLDVMGHGTLPALFAYALHDVVRYAAGGGMVGMPGAPGPERSAPSTVVRRLNEKYASSGDMPFFNIAYGDYDAATGAFRLARAGHPPALLLRRDGSVEILRSAGTALGAFRDIQTEELSGTLKPGERLGLFSDGLLEAFDRDNPGHAIDLLASRFAALASAKPSEAVRALGEAAGASVAGHGSRDDMSALLVERPA